MYITELTMAYFVGSESDIGRLKIAVLGDKQVGKTSLLTRYARGTYSPIYLHTQGADIVEKKLRINGVDMELSLIDSAGHNYVRTLIKSIYRNVHGIMLVYDVTRDNTFTSLEHWIEEIHGVNSNNPYIVLVGNKNDLADLKTVLPDRVKEFARQMGLLNFEVSAKTGEQVSDTFHRFIEGTYANRLPGEFVVDSIKLAPKSPNDDEKDKQCCS